MTTIGKKAAARNSSRHQCTHVQINSYTLVADRSNSTSAMLAASIPSSKRYIPLWFSRMLLHVRSVSTSVAVFTRIKLERPSGACSTLTLQNICVKGLRIPKVAPDVTQLAARQPRISEITLPVMLRDETTLGLCSDNSKPIHSIDMLSEQKSRSAKKPLMIRCRLLIAFEK